MVYGRPIIVSELYFISVVHKGVGANSLVVISCLGLRKAMDSPCLRLGRVTLNSEFLSQSCDSSAVGLIK